jgi:hypothetical protein
LPRANKKTLGKEKKHSAQISLPRAKQLAVGKEIFKKSLFLSPICFYPQHILIQDLCSNLAQFELCLLYLTILLLLGIFFAYVRYELQMHEII